MRVSKDTFLVEGYDEPVVTPRLRTQHPENYLRQAALQLDRRLRTRRLIEAYAEGVARCPSSETGRGETRLPFLEPYIGQGRNHYEQV